MKKDLKIPVRSILLMTLSNLGDIILTMPVFTALCVAFPDAEIDVVSGSPGKEIFERAVRAGMVIIPGRKKRINDRMHLVRELRRKPYDLIIDLKGTLMPFLLRGRIRSGLSSYLKAGVRGSGEAVHKVHEHLSKISFLGVDSDRVVFTDVLNENDERRADELLKPSTGRYRVLINPGSKSHLKRWSGVKYAGVSDRIHKRPDTDVVIAGNEDDSAAVEEVLAHVKVPVIDISGKTSIFDLMEIMKKCDVVVTNDSAPLHMASAVGAKTVAVFGPTDERKYGPISPGSIVLKPDRPCRPCNNALCSTGPDEGCIDDVTAESVFNAVDRLLG